MMVEERVLREGGRWTREKSKVGRRTKCLGDRQRIREVQGDQYVKRQSTERKRGQKGDGLEWWYIEVQNVGGPDPKVQKRRLRQKPEKGRRTNGRGPHFWWLTLGSRNNGAVQISGKV